MASTKKAGPGGPAARKQAKATSGDVAPKMRRRCRILDGVELPYPLNDWQCAFVFDEWMWRTERGTAVTPVDIAREFALRFYMADTKADIVLGYSKRAHRHSLPLLQESLDAKEIDALTLLAIVAESQNGATLARQASAAQGKNAMQRQWVQQRWAQRRAGQYSKRIDFAVEMTEALRAVFPSVKISAEQIASDWVSGPAKAAGPNAADNKK